jgi:S-(hydroxymethyl)glutathione dehydrogenase/alcohol dehydrogenase
VPSCGRCKWCATGRGYICNEGAKLFDVGMMSDGRIAHRCKGEPVGRYAQVGTFSEYVRCSQNSVIAVDKDLPFHALALVSCGVGTGVGSATERAGTRPGDTVAVIGVGGIGINAVQGAALAGAKRVIAIDPVEFKREKAMEFGAAHTFASVDEALAAVPDLTWGDMCDRVVLSAGTVTGDMIDPALNLTAKGGTLVVTGLAPMMRTDTQLNLFMLSMLNKEVKGTIYGSTNPREAVPRLLSMYREGELKIDELVTRRYSLDEVNQGYADMRDGKNIRGVITFD